jgi:Tfp pilus assembly protein PilF
VANYRRALALAPNFVNAYNNLGTALEQQGRLDQAATQYRRMLELEPQNARAHYNLGNMLRAKTDYEAAIAHYKQALAGKPDFADAWNNMGGALAERGDLDAAREAYQKAVEADPTRAAYHRNLASSKRFEPGDPQLAVMEQLVRNLASVPEYERIDLQFALGKAYEDLKQHERSFRHLLAGNKLKRAQIHYDEAGAMDYMQRIRTVFDAARCKAKAGGGEPAPTPVFIVGMPRSGTTLIEQIIASHPKAVGAGDFDNIVQSLTGLNGGALSFPEVVATMSGEQLRQVGARYLAAVRALAPTAERVADKMPWNFHFPGLIHLALPNARIIHACRDPVDTCLSCFSILFEGAGNPFTYDLGELGRFYRAYDSLMAYWRAVLPPGLMLEVRYEEVVGELEKQARSIIAHCGLEWDDACLAFHATRRPVRTSSVAQVRKPIYHSSVGRWRPYRDQLRPLFEELGIDSENESAPSAPPAPVAVAGRIQPAITGPEIHQTPTTAAPRRDTIAPISKDQSWRVYGHVTTTKWIVAAGAALALLSVVALAQAPSPQQIWERMPHMQLEAEYAGPMKDTTIQRWRDPGLNVVCYLYLPFTAQHSTPTASGYVQYGANTIGTISCLPVLASAPPKANGPAPSAAKATPPPQGRP